ncbi:P-type conjugative transfer protein TrbG [Hyphococcus sp.]|uniref:P-type conjugative transfer protein TrbG n=1 Tax=Hyphococcus sp. TaxID=2038636 RepID=UPI003CCC0152
MNKIMISASLATLLTACETYPAPSQETYVPAVAAFDDETTLPVEIVETPKALPLPGQLKAIPSPSQKSKTASATPEDAIAEGAKKARIEPSLNGYINAVQVYPYTEGALYRLYAAPGQVSDIALQPGETLISVSAGDTVRWVVGDTTSGGPEGERAHILVKPIGPGLSTNLMIATDRRVYHLELSSTDGAYMAALSWRYPQDELDGLRARNRNALARDERTIAKGLALGDLNFAYRIEGDRPDWRPVRVFDDGRQVFIQMPAAIATTDAPPLFVVGRKGGAELVNYRVKDNYYIVDRLFSRAELRHGEKNQTIVRIVKTGEGGRG